VNDLQGTRALVVGAGSGIGRAVVDAFLGHGASVAALELDAGKAADLEGSLGSLVVCGDATSWSDTEAAVEMAVDAFGGLDVLVNCVGLFDYYRGLDDLGIDEIDAGFDEAFNVNVKSSLISVKVALDHLRAAKGCVILTASTSAFYPGRGGLLYVATKFALRGVVTALAHELAPEVRVNAVAPGGTLNTDLRGFTSLGLDDRALGDAPGRAEDLKGRVPLQVALEPSDHAASYVFLASAAARGMTGTFLHPDGGMSVSAPQRRGD
jgi:NAD(P)-dependent dehydrogenase (short-subunit alcohol dehydrogenase family)